MTARKIIQELERGVGASVINLVSWVIEHAHKLGASDIHIDPTEDSARVRLRIDGRLQDAFDLPHSLHLEMVMRIKILSNLRTDEHRSPQDGRFRHGLEKFGAVDLRVSVVPTYYGESLVLRLLVDRAEELSFEKLGFSEGNTSKVLEAIRKPHGMILATGPTGSGKTTTLYTGLKFLNERDVSIITIEDPIEYAISGIKQLQVNQSARLNFVNGLRSILRQDPNVIMVGEIRDNETASLAVNTALTGHLVLSTLHTSDSATTLPRLLDMGVEPFLLASTVNIAIGQRLVRKICEKCKAKRSLKKAERDNLLLLFGKSALKGIGSKESFCYGKGCKACHKTGYSGRIGIQEVLVVDNERIREAILRKASASEIKRIAIKNGMIPMLNDGFEKAIAGKTTIEEILGAVHG